MHHAFGRAAPLTLGIEEELLLVDRESLALAHVSSGLVPRTADRPGEVKHDVFEAMAELASPIVRDAESGTAALGDLRAALLEAGATLLGCGIHPQAALADVVHVPEERYRAISASMRGLLSRTPTAALHVHVGMPDPEAAIAVCNRMRAHLPLLQALAASSPYWHGLDSGFATARAQLFRGYPRAVIPPLFADWEDYVNLVRWWQAAGDLPDYTFLWWDIRPHPNLGTVEIRAMDAQSRLESVAGLAALVHGLAAACLDGAAEIAPPSEALMESSFRAGRDGVDAAVWWRGRMRSMRVVGRDALALARPYARDLGGDAALEEIDRILHEGGGADRMRAAHAAGGMREVLEQLAFESAEPYCSTQTTSPSRTHL